MAGISARFSHETTIFTAIQPRLLQRMKNSKAQKNILRKTCQKTKKEIMQNERNNINSKSC